MFKASIRKLQTGVRYFGVAARVDTQLTFESGRTPLESIKGYWVTLVDLEVSASGMKTTLVIVGRPQDDDDTIDLTIGRNWLTGRYYAKEVDFGAGWFKPVSWTEKSTI